MSKRLTVIKGITDPLYDDVDAIFEALCDKDYEEVTEVVDKAIEKLKDIKTSVKKDEI